MINNEFLKIEILKSYSLFHRILFSKLEICNRVLILDFLSLAKIKLLIDVADL